MYREIEQLVEAFEAGRVTRRQLVGGLGAVVATAVAGSGAVPASGTQSTFRSVGLNHVALRVTDIPRSRDFYVKHLGVRVLQDGSRNCFLGCGANNFVALFQAQEAGLAHYCYTIEDYEAGRAVETLRGVGLEPERHANRVYFEDPDGLTVQLASEWGDYPGSRP